MHKTNTPIFLQLIHAGGLIQENIYNKYAIAPSKTELLGKMLPHYYGEGKFPIPMEITKHQILETIKNFSLAAKMQWRLVLMESKFTGQMDIY